MKAIRGDVYQIYRELIGPKAQVMHALLAWLVNMLMSIKIIFFFFFFTLTRM